MSNINLVFTYKGNNISMQCQPYEKLSDVYRRFSTKIQRNVGDFNFFLNAREVPPCDKTLEQLQVSNFCKFDAVGKDVIGA